MGLRFFSRTSVIHHDLDFSDLILLRIASLSVEETLVLEPGVFILYIFLLMHPRPLFSISPPSTADRHFPPRGSLTCHLRLLFTARAVGTQNVCNFAFFQCGVCRGCCIIWCQFIFCPPPRFSGAFFSLVFFSCLIF